MDLDWSGTLSHGWFMTTDLKNRSNTLGFTIFRSMMNGHAANPYISLSIAFPFSLAGFKPPGNSKWVASLAANRLVCIVGKGGT